MACITDAKMGVVIHFSFHSASQQLAVTFYQLPGNVCNWLQDISSSSCLILLLSHIGVGHSNRYSFQHMTEEICLFKEFHLMMTHSELRISVPSHKRGFIATTFCLGLFLLLLLLKQLVSNIHSFNVFKKSESLACPIRNR